MRLIFFGHILQITTNTVSLILIHIFRMSSASGSKLKCQFACWAKKILEVFGCGKTDWISHGWRKNEVRDCAMGSCAIIELVRYFYINRVTGSAGNIESGSFGINCYFKGIGKYFEWLAGRFIIPGKLNLTFTIC